ncbi:Uncharacterized protein APZ42_007036, partial [Daphnia magna]|uniref:Uncharacterized protein n=2 Tax=Daphnia magna TaxID=35525 RepID=A0ABR0AGV3_9CRUS
MDCTVLYGYLLPTSADGLILSQAEDFYTQAELMEQKEAGSKHILLEFVVKGERFQSMTTAFQQPYPSSDYHIQIVSKLEEYLHDISIQQVKGKMYTWPMSISGEELISDEIPDMS